MEKLSQKEQLRRELEKTLVSNLGSTIEETRFMANQTLSNVPGRQAYISRVIELGLTDPALLIEHKQKKERFQHSSVDLSAREEKYNTVRKRRPEGGAQIR